MKDYPFNIPQSKKIRVMIDTDAASEADDQYAIAQALMSGKLEVRGIMAEHFLHIPGSMEMSLQEIRKVLSLMEVPETLALEGAPQAMPGEGIPVESPASRALIKEAMSDDPRPLFVLCQGALTNVASAIAAQPECASRMQIIMIAGANYPEGGFEFNTMNDPSAFNTIMNSKASVWVIPEEVYSTMQISMTELKMKVAPCGQIGRYLYENTCAVIHRMTQTVPADPNASAFEQALAFPNGESWSLGDSPAVGLLLMHNAGEWEEVPAPNVLPDTHYIIPDPDRKVRWYKTINQRCILEDFFAKLAWNFGT